MPNRANALASQRRITKAHWLGPDELRSTYPQLSERNLQVYRQIGCRALEGKKLRGKVIGPPNRRRTHYHQADIERIAAVPCLPDGVYENERGTWLSAVAIKRIFGLNATSRWRKHCPLIGHAIENIRILTADEYSRRLICVRVYLRSDVEALIEARDSRDKPEGAWLTAREVEEQFGFRAWLAWDWARKKIAPLGRPLRHKIENRQIATGNRPVMTFSPDDLETIRRYYQDRNGREWVAAGTAGQEYGFSLGILSKWRKGCPPLGGRPISSQIIAARTTAGRKARANDGRKLGRRVQHLWHYRRSDLEEIKCFFEADPDRFVDQAGVVWLSPVASERAFGIPAKKLRQLGKRRTAPGLDGPLCSQVRLLRRGRVICRGLFYREDHLRRIATHLSGQQASVADTELKFKPPEKIGDNASSTKPTSNEHAYLSPRNLADEFKVPFDALRMRLNRFRQKNHKGWIENPNRGPREPEFLYQIMAVRPIARELQSKSC